MGIRAKTRRRLAVLLGGLVLLVGLAAGAYLFRSHQMEQRAVRGRDEGTRALEQGDYTGALHKIGPYLQRHPDDTDALYHYALAREKVEEPDGKHIAQAISLFRRVIDRQPEHRDARRALLALYQRSGYSTEAVATADALLAQDTNDLQSLYAKALALTRLRRFDEALKVAQRHNELAPLHLEGQILTLNVLLHQDGGRDQLLRRVESLADAHPNDARFELLRSVGLALAGDPGNARTWVQRAAAHMPADDTDSMVVLVNQLDALGLFGESLAALQRSVTSSGEAKIELRRMLAARLWQVKRYDGAAQQLASVDPGDLKSDTELLALKALTLMRLGRLPEARAHVQALAGRGQDQTAQRWASVLQAHLAEPPSDDKQIIDVCQEGLRQAPANPYFHHLLAQAYARAGDEEAAVEHGRRASLLAPAWAEPLIEVAGHLSAMGRVQQAVNAAEAACARAPEDPAALTSVVIAALPAAGPNETGWIEHLLKLIGNIRQLDPGNEQVLHIQVGLLAQRGQKDAAIAMLSSLLGAERPPLAEATYLRLAAVSAQFQLGLEDACFDRSEQVHGISAELAYARAKAMLNKGLTAQGAAYLDQTRQAASGRAQEVAWRKAWARYLDLAQDPRAKSEWIQLGEEAKDSVNVQWMALDAKAVQSEHEFLGRTIERLRPRVGQQAMGWRMARARWLLQGSPGDRELNEASGILTDIIRSVPESLDARLLLAGCFEQLGNTTGAIEQLTAAAKLAPSNNLVGLRLARLLQQQGDYQRARDYLDPIVKNDSMNPAERREVATLLAQQGDASGALSLLQRAPRGQSQGTQPAPDLLLAVLYRNQNRLKEAEAICQTLLQKPDLATISFAAGFYAAQGRKAEAEQILAKLDQVEAPAGMKELARGDYWLGNSGAASALEHYRAAVKAAPANPLAWRQLISCHIAMGQVDQAVAASIEASRALPMEHAFAYFAQQESLLKTIGSEPVARPLVIALLDRSTDQDAVAEALNVLADANRNEQSPDQVLIRLRPMAERHPRILPLQVLVAEVCMSMGRWDDAASFSTRAMQAFPVAPEPAALAARALAAAGRWAEVLVVAREWRQRSLSRPLAADLMIANACLATGDPSAAEQLLRPYIEVLQANGQFDAVPEVVSLYAHSLAAGGRVDQAAGLLWPLVEKSRPWRAAWIQLTNEGIADPKLAAQWLERVAPLAASDAGLQVLLASAWHQLSLRANDPQYRQVAQATLSSAAQAVESSTDASAADCLSLALLQEINGSDAAVLEAAYRRVLKKDASSAVAMNNLAMVLVRRGGDLAEAERLAAGALKSNPKTAAFMDTLACVQMHRKDYAAAVRNLEQALSQQPGNLVFQVNLASALTESGQLDRARTVLARIESQQPKESALEESVRRDLQELRTRLNSRGADN